MALCALDFNSTLILTPMKDAKENTLVLCTELNPGKTPIIFLFHKVITHNFE